MKKIKVGIVGMGHIAKKHIRGYLANPEVEIYAFCDNNEENLKNSGEEYGVTRLYKDFSEMLSACPELDAVSVCTSNSTHAPFTIMALRAGKHVLCEKPMAMNAEECAEMLKVSKECKRVLMVGFVRRFGADTVAAKACIGKGEVGNIFYAKARFIRKDGYPGRWFGTKSISGGGSLIDIGIHVLDLSRYLMGNPKAVSVFGATFSENPMEGGIEDVATALVRFENGSVISLEASFRLNMAEDVTKVELFGDCGGIYVGDSTYLYKRGEEPQLLCDDRGDYFIGEIGAFVDAIRSGDDTYNTAENGVEIMKIIDAIYLSAQEGREVEII